MTQQITEKITVGRSNVLGMLQLYDRDNAHLDREGQSWRCSYQKRDNASLSDKRCWRHCQGSAPPGLAIQD